MWHKQGTKRSGFTLVELLIVISIIAILAALALPSYQGSVRKARRSDAQAELTEFAGSMERRFTQTNSYTGLTLPANSDFYTFSFVDAVTATTYTIRATPTAVQSEDACGTMNLDQDGNKTHTGSLAGCWD